MLNPDVSDLLQVSATQKPPENFRAAF